MREELLKKLFFRMKRKLDASQRQRYQSTGRQFVNAVLRQVDKPPLTENDYETLVSEVIDDKFLTETYERHLPFLHSTRPDKQSIKGWRDRFHWSSGMHLAAVNIFYILPRVLRPTVLIETGVASGEATTSFLLASLHRNNHGKLFSIDLPPQRGMGCMDWTLEKGMDVGFFVPSKYRDRWSLITGDATYELPKLLQGSRVDYFVHDSDHTFEHMIYEFSMAVKHVNCKGIIVSDDIEWNQAFFQVFETMGYPIFIDERNTNLGLVVTP